MKRSFAFLVFLLVTSSLLFAQVSNLSISYNLLVLPTRTNPSLIYSLPLSSQYLNVAPFESEKNLEVKFQLYNNSNSSIVLKDWGVLISGGQNTGFRIHLGAGMTISPYSASPVFDLRGYLTDDQMLSGSSTLFNAQVQVTTDGSTWLNIAGGGSTYSFTVFQRPPLTNGKLIKRPRRFNSTDPSDVIVYYYQHNKVWVGTQNGFNGLFPGWNSSYYVYPIDTIANLGAPATPNTNSTTPQVAGLNLLYQVGVNVYIIEPEPNTSSPLKSKLFQNESAFYSYGYTPFQLETEPIPLTSSQASWIQSQYPVGSTINAPGTNLLLLSPAANITVASGEINFSWSDVGATRYELYVDNNSGFGSPEVSPVSVPVFQSYNQTSYTLNANWLSQNTWYWKVKAYFSNGPTIESPVQSFTYTPPTQINPTWVPVYRAFLASKVDHFYCTNANHLATAIQKGYRFEKVDGYMAINPFSDPDMVPVYRFYDPTVVSHYYTTDEGDKNLRIIAGLTYEGITGYVYHSPHPGLVGWYYDSLYNSQNQALGDYFYTTSQLEAVFAANQYGYHQHGLIAYLSPNGDGSTLSWMESQPGVGEGINPQNGNFNSYTKTSFSISGRRMTLEFAHSYNSFATHLPSPFSPLGPGWTHPYNAYLTISAGQIYIFWPDGNIHIYNAATNLPITKGVYDILTNLGNGNYAVKKKDQTVYNFQNLSGLPDASDVLVSIVDKNNNTTYLSYDPAYPRLISITNPENRSLHLQYHTEPRQEYLIKQIIDPIGRSIQYDYDTSGNLVRFTDPKGQVTTYAYDPTYPEDHLLKTIIRPDGSTLINSFTPDKKIWTQSHNNLQPLSLTYNGTHSTLIDESNHEFDFVYTNQTDGMISQLIYGGFNVSYIYGDSDHNPTKPTQITDGNGNVTMVTYDFRGNVLHINQPLGITHQFMYDGMNDVLSYTDPRGKVTSYTYDANGNLQSIQTPRGTTNFNYQSYGLLHTIVDPLIRTTTLGYNSFGNVTSVQDNLGHASQYFYDGSSRLSQMLDPLGRQTNYSNDNNDLTTSVQDANSKSTSYTYDALDRLVGTRNARGQLYSFMYDGRDQLINKQDPLSHQTSYNYYPNGQLESRTDPNGQHTQYTYDNIGRLEIINYPSSIVNIGYDNNNNIISISDQNGSMGFSFDQLNRLISYRDYYHNIVNYGYDASSNIVSTTYPGGKMVQYSYDDDNKLHSVSDWNNNTTLYTYNSDGSLQQIQFPNGVTTTYTYDGAGRLTGLANKKSDNTIISSYAYQLDNAGNQTSVTQVEPLAIPPLTSQNISYSYDNANRIISAGSTTFSFDNNGNLKSKNDGTQYTYDAENRLLNVSGTNNASYIYDAFGNRRAATRNGAATRYILGISGSMSQVLMETDASNNPTAYYIYGLGLVARLKPNGSTRYYHSDSRGSTIAMTDQNQNLTHKYVYGAYGEVLSKVEEDTNRFRYVGGYGVMDEGNGLYFMRARFFDPIIGRFTSEDPKWNQNLFVYAVGNPNTNIDPLGMTSGKTWGTVLGIALSPDVGESIAMTIAVPVTKFLFKYYDYGLRSTYKQITGKDPTYNGYKAFEQGTNIANIALTTYSLGKDFNYFNGIPANDDALKVWNNFGSTLIDLTDFQKNLNNNR